MENRKPSEWKIDRHTNYLGGLWFTIEVSKELTTEINIFVGIKEFQVAELLKNPYPKEHINSALEMELFRSEQQEY